MGMEWVTGSLGGVLANPGLSKEMRIAAQASNKFRQFAAIKADFGKGVADSVNFDKISNLVNTGGTLVETSTMPGSYFTIIKDTLTVTEYGISVPFTGKLESVSAIGIKNITVKALKNDQVKVLDYAVRTQMAACMHKYVASSATASNWTSNGTATLTASTNLNAYHTKEIIDKLLILNAPPVDGENYMCIASVKAARGLYDDLQSVWQYTKYPVNGEVGSYYRMRLVRDTFSVLNGIGTSGTAAGEAFFFGDDSVQEGVALPEEIRFEESDFGRSKRLAWYAILGFKIIWVLDPDARIVHFTSA